jgi:hypothetical protein
MEVRPSRTTVTRLDNEEAMMGWTCSYDGHRMHIKVIWENMVENVQLADGRDKSIPLRSISAR